MLELPNDSTQVWGHRGASAHAPENTGEAFRLAREQGADGVELDVRRTRDGALVIHHDAVTGSGRIIVEHTAEEIRRLEPGMLTLEEAMAACSGMVVNVEIKNTPGDPDYSESEEQAPAVVGWLSAAGATQNVVVSSFNPATIDRVRALDPGLATAQLLLPWQDPIAEMPGVVGRGHRGINPSIHSAGDMTELVDAARAHRLWVTLWTVDDPQEIREAAAAGVNAIITNDPAAARETLRGPSGP